MANKLERASVACLRVDLYLTLDQLDRAVGVCLEYLRHLDVEWPSRPTDEEAQREYQQVWMKLGNRASSASFTGSKSLSRRACRRWILNDWASAAARVGRPVATSISTSTLIERIPEIRVP